MLRALPVYSGKIYQRKQASTFFFLLTLTISVLLCSACRDKNLNETPQQVPTKNRKTKLYDVPGLGKFHLFQKPDHIQDMLRSGRVWENYLHEYFQKYVKAGSNVVDAGAFVGSHTIKLAQLAYPGKVFAFEPQEDVFELLKRNIEANNLDNVQAHPIALGDRSCKTKTIEGVVRKPNQGAVSVAPCSSLYQNGSIPMQPLDHYQIDNLSFMKIDVEGSEAILLEGARETIKRNKPVMVIEIKKQRWQKNVSNRGMKKRVIEDLASMGYQVTRIRRHNYLALPKESHQFPN